MNSRKRCFVIMPYGKKKDDRGIAIDFDEIYDKLIQPAITGQPMRAVGGPEFDCVRCDKIALSGSIHREMVDHIFDADVAIVDISLLNANVLYELGVRHALRPGVTVLMCQKGTKPPFNIHGLKYIAYPPGERGREKAQQDIANHVINGLRDEHVDSPVHLILGDRLPGLPPKRLDPGTPYVFKLRNVPDKRLGILTGDLRYIGTKIDIWVNSENTNMQMARLFDASGSAVIRYLGAKKDSADQVTEDTIALHLKERMQDKTWVPPGTILETKAGDLQQYGVKHIFHAAVVQGDPGRGWVPMQDVGVCVFNALTKADLPEFANENLRSILFPLMGTGTGRARLRETIERLIGAAIKYFESRPRSVISEVYFLALTDQQRDACLSVFAKAMVDPCQIHSE